MNEVWTVQTEGATQHVAHWSDEVLGVFITREDAEAWLDQWIIDGGYTVYDSYDDMNAAGVPTFYFDAPVSPEMREAVIRKPDKYVHALMGCVAFVQKWEVSDGQP